MIEINAETQEQATILLVDDNAINLQLLFETLDGQATFYWLPVPAKRPSDVTNRRTES